jgi:hypothetical protein
MSTRQQKKTASNDKRQTPPFSSLLSYYLIYPHAVIFSQSAGRVYLHGLAFFPSAQ